MSCGDILWRCLGRKKVLFGCRGIVVMTRCQGWEDEFFLLLAIVELSKDGGQGFDYHFCWFGLWRFGTDGFWRDWPRGVNNGVNGDRKSTRLNSSHLGISYA